MLDWKAGGAVELVHSIEVGHGNTPHSPDEPRDARTRVRGPQPWASHARVGDEQVGIACALTHGGDDLL